MGNQEVRLPLTVICPSLWWSGTELTVAPMSAHISLFCQVGILPCLFPIFLSPNPSTQSLNQILLLRWHRGYLFLTANLFNLVARAEDVASCLTLPSFKFGVRSFISPFVLIWATFTKYHRLDGLNNRNVCLTAWRLRSPRSGCQHGLFLVRALFLVCRLVSSFCVLTWQKVSSSLSCLL